MTVYEPGPVDDVARYQAKKLAKEGDAAFARAYGEFARNDAFRSLNETIITNVGRKCSLRTSRSERSLGNMREIGVLTRGRIKTGINSCR